MRQAAETMDQAGQRLMEHRNEVNINGKPETAAGAEAIRLQGEALRRLEQLLNALKEEQASPLALARRNEGQPEEDENVGSRAGDSISSITQLKLLRQMQAELNARTEEFRRKHPDLDKFDDKDRDALQNLRRQQQEIAELLEEMTEPAKPKEGDKP